jgi:hypothetical protein
MAQTRSCSTNNSKLEACDKALKAADDVIKKQGDLLLLVGNQNAELKSENQQLADAIVELRDQSDDRNRDLIITAGGGLVVGLILGFLVGQK